MKKFMLLILLSFLTTSLQGCWWAWTTGISIGASFKENKERKKDEIEEAKIHEKYKIINRKRAHLGLPPVEKPEYQREKSTLFY